MKIIQYMFLVLCVLAIGGCSKKNEDPIVSINLTERRGTERIETRVDRSGKVFKGYYHESNNIYERTTESTIPSEEANKIWFELGKMPIKRPWFSMDPEGNFKSIGVTWEDAGSTYGVSYSYEKIPPGSPLASVLKIIQRNGLDTWRVPEKRIQ